MKLLYVFPVRKNQIMFYSFAGKQFSDSPKYISDYVLEHDANQHFRLIWAVNIPREYQNYEKPQLHFIKYKGVLFFFEYIRSKYIITNMGPIRAIPRRKGQEIINTWHGGGAYKKVGVTASYKHELKYEKLYSEMAMSDVTLFLSSSEAFTRECIHNAHHYFGKVMNVGLPRNDVLLNKKKHGTIKDKVRQAYNLEKAIKIVLFAPTWRNYSMEEYEKIDIDRLLLTLKRKFGGSWVLLYRAHNLAVEDFVSNPKGKSGLINATQYSDVQELLLATDILITDYSSVIWDYSLLFKPAFLFASDYEYYNKQFGFCTPVSDWGFKLCKSNDELNQCIADYDNVEQLQAIENNHDLFVSYETGEACKRVYDYIISST